jgi:hypothetical protein
MVSTNGALVFGGKQFGSPGRIRTYNPSVNRTLTNVISETYAGRSATSRADRERKGTLIVGIVWG